MVEYGTHSETRFADRAFGAIAHMAVGVFVFTIPMVLSISLLLALPILMSLSAMNWALFAFAVLSILVCIVSLIYLAVYSTRVANYYRELSAKQRPYSEFAEQHDVKHSLAAAAKDGAAEG